MGVRQESDKEFQAMITENYPDGIDSIREYVLHDAHNYSPKCHRIWDKYKQIYDYFDDWVVIKTDNEHKEITGVLLHKNQDALGDNRVETIDWEET